MRTRSSSNLPVESPPNPSTSNPKRRNRRRSNQPFILEESPVDTMADQRTMAELLRAPTEGYAEAIMVPLILAEQFELKHSLIIIMTSDQFFGLKNDNPHDHIRWFNKINSTIKYKDVPNSAIKLLLFPFSLAGAACRWLEKESSRSILTWEDLEWDRYKDLLRACPHHGFTELHQLDTFYNALNPADQDSLNSAVGGNLLKRRTQDVLTIMENKSKVRSYRNKSIVSQVKSSDSNSSSFFKIAKLTHAVNQQTSAVTTAMTSILKQFQATPPSASVKAVEEICVTCGGAHPYYQCLATVGNTFIELRDNIQGYVAAAAVNYNQVVPLSELEKVKRMNEANMKAIQTQINTVKNELRNEMKNSIQASMSNQTNELNNMMASFFQMNIASTSCSGSFPSNTIANPKRELKAITTQSGIVLDGPSIPIPSLTDQDLLEYTIKVPPPLKMLKALLSNKEKLLELANTPFNKNCLAAILKKLPEKLGDPGKFLIPCGFSELKCKSLADLGARINLMSLSVWKKLGLPKLIFTRMTLELANRANYTPAGIARDVFVLVGKFTFPADFVIVDYESDPRVPLILGRPFLRTARALIDTDSGSTTTHVDYSLPKYDSFLFEIDPDKGELTSVLMKDNLAEPRVHVPNVLTTHPTLMLDSDFIPSDNSLPEFETFYFDIEEKNSGSITIHTDISLPDLECFNFNFKPAPGELTSIVDFRIRENVLSATNVNLPPEEDHSPLFVYVVWILLSFLMYLVVPPNLLSFGNEDTIFNPGITNYHFPPVLPNVSHRCKTFMKFNVYPKLLNESPMEILSSSFSPMKQ
nr:reverse transcriptase domain-containing protein [Tanacetum cinerariifolium]